MSRNQYTLIKEAKFMTGDRHMPLKIKPRLFLS